NNTQQKKLNSENMNFVKFIKKTAKHIIFYIIAFVIGNTFLSYIIGIDQLITIITDPPSKHMEGLFALILFSGAFYFNFAFFREQACTLVCPYGRLQSVLLDIKTIVVAYDFKRGEPRGKLVKGKPATGNGDCIDCRQCVHVCPTGIDIRNGTQLECINCTSCIDVCNNVMQKIKKPKGLIRYSSYLGIEKGEKLKFTSRIIGYSTVLILLLTLLTTLIFLRKPIETTILRTPGVLYQELDDGKILNLYNLKIINKTFQQQKIQLSLKDFDGEIEIVSGDLIIPEGELKETLFFIRIPKEKLKVANTSLKIQVSSGDEIFENIKTSFMGPNPFKK
ncbi:MAG: cytochrome c oxidase accessory protein CcoG, partial [Calditrichia bacterium]|nr:cytochrome c oxidase accessory protein CcoG [Calditrichia bacterium]